MSVVDTVLVTACKGNIGIYCPVTKGCGASFALTRGLGSMGHSAVGKDQPGKGQLRGQSDAQQACIDLQDAFRGTTGLPISTYFSAFKWLWLLENVEAVGRAAAEERCMVGTMDSWLMYNLTGGVHGTHLLNISSTAHPGQT